MRKRRRTRSGREVLFIEEVEVVVV